MARNAIGGISHPRGRALDDANGIAVVHAKRSGTGEPFDFASGINILQCLLEPLCLRTVNVVTEQVTTHFEILLNKHDIGPCAGCVEGGTKASGSRANDKDVGVIVVPVIAVDIGIDGRGA